MGNATDADMMALAFAEAEAAAEAGEVPVGAVVVRDGVVLGRGRNAPISALDPTAHAEIVALRAAAQAAGNYRLPGATLYVTLEPCVMCAGAISFARVARLVYAASDAKGGAVAHGPRFFEQPTCHHRPVVEQGPLAAESSALLKGFFKARRR